MELSQDMQEQREEIIKKYPKSLQLVRDYFVSKMKAEAAEKDLPPEFVTEAENSFTQEFAAMIVLYSTDRVFEVLDDKGIIVSVFYDDGTFVYTNNRMGHSTSAGNRPQANKAAIEEVFTLIENDQLN